MNNERCATCDKPIATEEDWKTIPEGEGRELCWSGEAGCMNPPVDWRGRALNAEQAIRDHRTVTVGHGMCWENDRDLWSLIEPEAVAPDRSPPPWPEFMTHCAAYRASRERDADFVPFPQETVEGSRRFALESIADLLREAEGELEEAERGTELGVWKGDAPGFIRGKIAGLKKLTDHLTETWREPESDEP